MVLQRSKIQSNIRSIIKSEVSQIQENSGMQDKSRSMIAQNVEIEPKLEDHLMHSKILSPHDNFVQFEKEDFRQKYRNIQQRYNEQAALIEKYKADIKDLVNEIEKKEFIYQSSHKEANTSLLGGSSPKHGTLICPNS